MIINKKTIFGIPFKGGASSELDSYIDNELSTEERAKLEAKINQDSALSEDLDSQIKLQSALSSYFKNQEENISRPINVWPELLKEIEEEPQGNYLAELLEGVFSKKALIAGAAFSIILALTLTNFSSLQTPSQVATSKDSQSKSQQKLLSSADTQNSKPLDIRRINNQVNQITGGSEELEFANLENNAPIDYEWLRSERTISFVPVSEVNEMPVIWVNASAR